MDTYEFFDWSIALNELNNQELDVMQELLMAEVPVCIVSSGFERPSIFLDAFISGFDRAGAKVLIASTLDEIAARFNGVNIHREFSLFNEDFCGENSGKIRDPLLFRDLEVLVILDAFLLRRDILLAIDNLLRRRLVSNQLFGGLRVIFFADTSKLNLDFKFLGFRKYVGDNKAQRGYQPALRELSNPWFFQASILNNENLRILAYPSLKEVSSGISEQVAKFLEAADHHPFKVEYRRQSFERYVWRVIYGKLAIAKKTRKEFLAALACSSSHKSMEEAVAHWTSMQLSENPTDWISVGIEIDRLISGAGN